MSNVTKSTAFAYIPKKLFGMKKQSIKSKLRKKNAIDKRLFSKKYF
jgi:hypothetical protein